MKAKFGISIVTGAIAVTLAGTALAGPPSAQQAQTKYGHPEPPKVDRPDQGGQHGLPDQGGQYRHPEPPKVDQPDQGGQHDLPDQGGKYDQPDQGGQHDLPDQGGKYDQPDQGGKYDQPDHGGKGSVPRGMIPAPKKAFEIGVTTGYTQGFGGITEGKRVGCLAGAGLGLGLNLAYRVSPMFSIGVASQFQKFHHGDELQGGKAMGMTAGLDATWHLNPFRVADPFISVGTGYRLLWASPRGSNNNALTHGFQLAKLNTGLDLRVSKNVALGPMIGADINMFVWKNPESAGGDRKLGSMRVNTFVYAGLQGRFDVGGAHAMPGR